MSSTMRHDQYCAGLALEEQAQIIARSAGKTGTNADYLWNTVAHLDQLGLADADLGWLAGRVPHAEGLLTFRRPGCLVMRRPRCARAPQPLARAGPAAYVAL